MNDNWSNVSLQGKSKFDVDPDLQKRLEKYKTIEDFRSDVSKHVQQLVISAVSFLSAQYLLV